MRVLLLFEYGSLNGGEHSMLAAIRQLQGKVKFAAILPPSGPLVQALANAGVDLVSPLPQAAQGPQALLDQLLAVRSQVDLVHANSLAMSIRLGQIVSELQIPCTGHVRDIMRLSAGKRQALNQLQQVVCVSHAVWAHLVETGLPPEKLCTVYNGIDLQIFQPRPRMGWLRQQLGATDEASLVLNVGQICLRKGLDLFARAAVQIATEFSTHGRKDEQLPEVHFVHCGVRHSGKPESVEYERSVDAIFTSAGLSHRWHRLGERSDLALIYPEVDLLLHTARQEPLGRVLLEAAACALPIVATKVGGTAEILNHGDHGRLVPANDVAALARGAVRFLKDRPYAAMAGQSARWQMESKFSITESAEKLQGLWHSVVHQPQ